MANVLLIYPGPDQIKKRRFGFSLNLLYLSSILKSHGHTITGFLNYPVKKFTDAKLASFLKISDVVILELDAFPLNRSLNINSADRILKFISASGEDVKVIAFGHDLTLMPREIPFVDHAVLAEFEDEIPRLLSPATIYVPREYNLSDKNFDKLPWPDRSLVSDYAMAGGSTSSIPGLQKSTLIRASSGCLNTCTFCQRKGWGNKRLAHSKDYVLKEFEYLRDKNYKNIWICDDNFTFNLNAAKAILAELSEKGISKGMKIALSSWTKIDTEFLEMAKKANVSIISFGIESASEEILQFYKKKIDLGKTARLIKYADSIGLFTVGNFILGAPMETEESMEKTLQYALNVPFDQMNIKILDYMLGSELFDELPKPLTEGERHLFACSENRLNNFPLSHLKAISQNYSTRFAASREARLKKKIKRFGTPYALK